MTALSRAARQFARGLQQNRLSVCLPVSVGERQAASMTRRAAEMGRRSMSSGRYPLLQELPTYEQVYSAYKQVTPHFFNIGTAVVDKHVHTGHGSDLAMIHVADGGQEYRYSFNDILNLSNQLSNALHGGLDVKQGNVVGIYLPQCPEAAISHVAVYHMGAITLPLFTLFGPEAVQYRLQDSAARVVITDDHGLQVLLEIRDKLQHLHSIVVVRPHEARSQALPHGVHDFHQLVEKASCSWTPVATKAEDPALIIYTSGTTGNPKGCQHAHRVLLGHVPGVEMPHNFFPKEDDFFWTPADWAWIGGLLDVLLPSWYHRVPVLAHRMRKFDPDEAFYLMDKYRIRNTFMPPTALKLLRKGSTKKHQLRSLGSGGETLGENLLEWGRQTFGVTINEFYGQTECNLVLSNCSPIMPVKPGSMGRPVPGKTVAVVDKEGNVVGPNETGDIAVHRPDQTMFLEYLNLRKATKDKFRGNWMITGDQGRMDEDGYFWFVGRDDDIITSGSYRIGPGEIEDCLTKHPKVALAAVIGKPDPIRTEVVKAFVVLREEYNDVYDSPPRQAVIAKELQEYVKSHLAAHEYPREVEFIRELPTTTTGKVIRKALKDLEKARALSQPDPVLAMPPKPKPAVARPTPVPLDDAGPHQL